MNVTDTDWEIKQLWMAIDYYERTMDATLCQYEAKQLEINIKNLNQQIKQLEREKDERL
tara:strand:+ start:572 stop:748 length:177 start_codon:yes stop_codon:yes gene_type:complete